MVSFVVRIVIIVEEPKLCRISLTFIIEARSFTCSQVRTQFSFFRKSLFTASWHLHEVSSIPISLLCSSFFERGNSATILE